jgi:hypothetical protein
MLMAGLLDWTKRWDSELSPSTVEPVAKQGMVAHGRCLRQHDSDVSTLVPEADTNRDDEDDGTASLTSFAPTATWGVESVGQPKLREARSGRKPRYRPHRRAKRRERLSEWEDLKERMFRQSQEEMELDNGRLPLSMMQGLADNLMTIGEDDDDDWFRTCSFCSEGTGGSDPCGEEEEEVDACKGAQSDHIVNHSIESPQPAPSHLTPPQLQPPPARALCGSKRKQMESEFQDRDAAEEESTSRTPSSASCTGYTSQAATAGEYYGPMEAAMKEMLQALQVQVEHLGDLQVSLLRLWLPAWQGSHHTV